MKFVCSMNGVLEFVDASDVTVMAQTEHFMATDVEWDATGRYVVSAVSWWGHKVSCYIRKEHVKLGFLV